MIEALGVLDAIRKIDREQYDEEANRQFDAWRKDIEEAEAVRAVAESFVIKDMITSYRNEVERIDRLLLEKRHITELERENLLDKKELYKNFISSFDADARIARVAEQLKNL